MVSCAFSPLQSAIAIRDPMGIVIKEIGGLPEVAAIAEGGTFHKAGVVIGDILSHVNGVSVRDMPPSGTILSLFCKKDCSMHSVTAITWLHCQCFTGSNSFVSFSGNESSQL